MVTKQEFLQTVAKIVTMASDVPVTVNVTTIRRNNGKHDCIQVKRGRNTGVNVGVDSYYQAFCDGGISAVMAAAESVIQAQEDCEAHKDAMLNIAKEMTDYEQAKGMLMCRLVNTALNRDRLSEMPNIPFHDLSIPFYVMTDSGQGLITGITNNLLAKWGIGITELFRDALANMQAKAPAEFHSIFDAITGITGVPAEDMEKTVKDIGAPMLYILTSKDKRMGAAVILYPGILESCAEIMGGDFYLIPSSIHEFLLAPVSGMGPDKLQAVIREINQTEMPPEEALADHAYLYSAAQKKIIMV